MPRFKSNAIDDLKRLHSITSVLGIGERDTVIVCPLPSHSHSEGTPSFSIYYGRDGIQRFSCHGNCGARGDVVDLVGYLEVPGYDSASKDKVTEAMLRFNDRTPSTVIPKPVGFTRTATLNPSIWRKYVPAGIPVLDYAASRGLTPETLTHFRVGQKDLAMSMPTFHDGHNGASEVSQHHQGRYPLLDGEGVGQVLVQL